MLSRAILLISPLYLKGTPIVLIQNLLQETHPLEVLSKLSKKNIQLFLDSLEILRFFQNDNESFSDEQ